MGYVLFTASLTFFFSSMIKILPARQGEVEEKGVVVRIPAVGEGIAESAYIGGVVFLFTAAQQYCRLGLVGAGQWAGGKRYYGTPDSPVPGEFVVWAGGETQRATPGTPVRHD